MAASKAATGAPAKSPRPPAPSPEKSVGVSHSTRTDGQRNTIHKPVNTSFVRRARIDLCDVLILVGVIGGICLVAYLLRLAMWIVVGT